MGGRSRETKPVDRWDWVTELSDNRLIGYGEMSFSALTDKNASFTDFSKSALNWACAKEFNSRFGSFPEWYRKDS